MSDVGKVCSPRALGRPVEQSCTVYEEDLIDMFHRMVVLYTSSKATTSLLTAAALSPDL